MSKIARIINNQIVYSDTHAAPIEPTVTAANESRKEQRLKYRKEILQPNQGEYYRAYPEQAKNLSDGLRRQFS